MAIGKRFGMIAVLFTSAVATLSAEAASAGGSNEFRPYIIVHGVPYTAKWTTNAWNTNSTLSFTPLGPNANLPQRVIEKAKSNSITNGITMGQIVNELGPGYAAGELGVLTIWWGFSDGRTLFARPGSGLPGQIMILGDEGYGHIWWRTNTHAPLPGSRGRPRVRMDGKKSPSSETNQTPAAVGSSR
jgi:hypothetical protein